MTKFKVGDNARTKVALNNGYTSLPKGSEVDVLYVSLFRTEVRDISTHISYLCHCRNIEHIEKLIEENVMTDFKIGDRARTTVDMRDDGTFVPKGTEVEVTRITARAVLGLDSNDITVRVVGSDDVLTCHWSKIEHIEKPIEKPIEEQKPEYVFKIGDRARTTVYISNWGVPVPVGTKVEVTGASYVASGGQTMLEVSIIGSKNVLICLPGHIEPIEKPIGESIDEQIPEFNRLKKKVKEYQDRMEVNSLTEDEQKPEYEFNRLKKKVKKYQARMEVNSLTEKQLLTNISEAALLIHAQKNSAYESDAIVQSIANLTRLYELRQKKDDQK